MLANETTSTARRPKKSKPAVKPLPPKGRVRLSQILAAGFFGPSFFYEKIAGGFFPEADKLGSMSTWNVEHVWAILDDPSLLTKRRWWLKEAPVAEQPEATGDIRRRKE